MIDASGHRIPELLDAILKFFLFDTYVFNPVVLMDLVNSDKKKDMEVKLTQFKNHESKVFLVHRSKDGKFQNEFMKSLFFPKYPYDIWFIFWEKR